MSDEMEHNAALIRQLTQAAEDLKVNQALDIFKSLKSTQETMGAITEINVDFLLFLR